MERRKFFKSLGLLSLAAVMPKFLLGKENNIKVKEDKTVTFYDSVVGLKQPDGTYRHLKNHTIVSMDDQRAVVEDHLGNLKSYNIPIKRKYFWDRSPKGNITILTYHPAFDGPRPGFDLYSKKDIDVLNKLAKENPLPKFTDLDYNNGWAYKCTADCNNYLKSFLK